VGSDHRHVEGPAARPSVTTSSVRCHRSRVRRLPSAGALSCASLEVSPPPRWELHLPMKGDLVAQSCSPRPGAGWTSVALSTRWGWAMGGQRGNDLRRGHRHHRRPPRHRQRRAAAAGGAYRAVGTPRRRVQLVAPYVVTAPRPPRKQGRRSCRLPTEANGSSPKDSPSGMSSVAPAIRRLQELGSMICLEGDGMWLLLEDMYGGAGAAAISDDEEWCVVVGCGFGPSPESRR